MFSTACTVNRHYTLLKRSCSHVSRCSAGVESVNVSSYPALTLELSSSNDPSFLRKHLSFPITTQHNTQRKQNAGLYRRRVPQAIPGRQPSRSRPSRDQAPLRVAQRQREAICSPHLHVCSAQTKARYNASRKSETYTGSSTKQHVLRPLRVCFAECGFVPQTQVRCTR